MKSSQVLVAVAAVLVAAAGCGGSDPGDDRFGAALPSTTPAPVSTSAGVTSAPATVAPATTAPVTTAPPGTPATSDAPRLVVDDVAYATVSDAQRLDVYVPSDGPGPWPLVVFVHGGAWMTGDKRSEYALGVVPVLTSAGYAVAAVNYRLSGEAVFPAQLLDVKAAVRWLRANAEAYELDPDRIAAAGESAGAHLAALLGTTAGDAAFDDATLGNPGISSDVQAVVDWYGPVDLAVADAQLAANPACEGLLRPAGEPDPAATQLLGAPPAEAPQLAAAANPITYIDGEHVLPPFLIEHGDRDCVVPNEGSVALHDALVTVAGPDVSRLVIVPGSGHFTEFDAAGQIGTVLEFLAGTIGSESA